MGPKQWGDFSTSVLGWPADQGMESSESPDTRVPNAANTGKHSPHPIVWGLTLSDVSFGLRRLKISGESGIGFEIFGYSPDGSKRIHDHAWPRLQTLEFDYDQCVMDTLELIKEDYLETASSPTEAWRLGQAHNRVWEAATAAAQRMPELINFSLSSAFDTGPMFCLEGAYRRLTWAYDESWKGDDKWTPNSAIVEAWRNLAREREGKELRAVIRRKGEIIWEDPPE
ncbi:major facilitator superfamily domain-containing protein [Apiospora arundinis]